MPTNISAMPGISPEALAQRRVTTRSFSSAAAFSVNVNATMFRGRTVSLAPGRRNDYPLRNDFGLAGACASNELEVPTHVMDRCLLSVGE